MPRQPSAEDDSPEALRAAIAEAQAELGWAGARCDAEVVAAHGRLARLQHRLEAYRPKRTCLREKERAQAMLRKAEPAQAVAEAAEKEAQAAPERFRAAPPRSRGRGRCRRGPAERATRGSRKRRRRCRTFRWR